MSTPAKDAATAPISSSQADATMASCVTMNVGQRIVELIQAEGIDTIFSIPDPGLMQIHHEAVARGVKVVSPHHEQCGGFMADAYARMTGGPGIVMAGEGPGTANLLPAAVCASKENIPVVFVAGQRARKFDSAVRRSKFQYTPQPRFFEPAVKYAGVIEFADQVDDVFHEAFRQAMTGRPGPVYVELPEEHQFTELPFGAALPPECYRLTTQQASPTAVANAAALLVKAKMPVLLVGTGVHVSRGHDAFEALARLLKCPVIQTWGGRGVLPDTDSQLLVYATEPASAALAAADVVLAVGTSIGETIHYGRARHFEAGDAKRRWIYIERDPTAIGVNRRIDVPLVGNLIDVVPQLCEALKQYPAFTAPPALAQWRSETEWVARALIESAPNTVPVHPGRLMVEVARVMPQNAIVVRDGGCTALFEMAYRTQLSRDYLWTSKFGHLGAGLPYAIGAQLAAGDDRRVCLITGDSALMFHTTELETAVRHNLPIVVVVNYDQQWGMELDSYTSTFGEGIELRHGKVRLDVVARGLGAHGEYCRHSAEIGPAMQRAFAAGKPAVVQVETDPEVNGLQAPNWDEFATWYGVDGAYKSAGTDYTGE